MELAPVALPLHGDREAESLKVARRLVSLGYLTPTRYCVLITKPDSTEFKATRDYGAARDLTVGTQGIMVYCFRRRGGLHVKGRKYPVLLRFVMDGATVRRD